MKALRAHTAVAALLLLAPLRAPAVEWVSAGAFHLETNNALTVQTLLHAASARMDGEALDDLFVLSADTALNGRAAGDVWVLGNTVALSGPVAGHARVVAQTLTVSGVLDQDLSAVASVARITTNAAIRGAVDLVAEQASLEGSFHGRARILARSATLAGTYADTVRVIADDIIVLPGTRIAGDLVYTSPRELFLDRSVLLGGELKRREAAAPPEKTWRDWIGIAAAQSARALAAMLCGVAFIALFPRLAGRSVRHLHRTPVRCALRGLAAALGLPLAAGLLALTLVGLPLALLLAGLWLAGLYLAKVAVGLWIGHLLFQRTGPRPHAFGPTALRLLAGLATLYAVTLLPLIGGSLALLIGFSGFGALWFAVLRGDDRRTPPAGSPDAPDETT